jgi:hypothetical protein
MSKKKTMTHLEALVWCAQNPGKEVLDNEETRCRVNRPGTPQYWSSREQNWQHESTVFDSEDAPFTFAEEPKRETQTSAACIESAIKTWWADSSDTDDLRLGIALVEQMKRIAREQIEKTIVVRDTPVGFPSEVRLEPTGHKLIPGAE